MELRTRQPSGSDSTDQFLNLIADPFQAEVQQNSIYAAIVWSFAISGLLFILFCYLRPRNSRVYAPRAKHADSKHAPITLGRGPFGWLSAVKDVTEQDLVEKIGLDAVVFLRFLRMLRNIFAVLTVVGCGVLIPVTLVGGGAFYEQYDSIATLMRITPQYIFGQKFWAFVVCSYLFEGTVCFFVWWNYRKIYDLRRAYFNSMDYQASLHSRTLLLTHIPESARTDVGIVELLDEAKGTQDVPRAAIGRNMKDLPELIKAHDKAVRELEANLAEYLNDPNKLPGTRPTCKVVKEDRAVNGKEKVDAIGYWANRIARLEMDIENVRESIDKRNPMPYGFASYSHIEDAHAVAHTTQKKGPGGSSVYLAPKPHDLLWQNLAMSRVTRRARIFWDGLWMVLFTIAFIVPNILTSVFLSDFSHLGLVWPSFQSNLAAHPTGWGIAQGILAPLVQTLMYTGIPVMFRRLYTHSGDVSKTSRERHVTARLYVFFVFNNLFVFSVFGSAWRFVASVVAAQDQGIWEAIRSSHLFSKVMTGLCNVSTFWLTWQMQRNLSAAIDISQAWPLVWSFIVRKFFSPTPRQFIELTTPQPFQYADYYNNYLQVAVVGLCFGTLQPIILPVTAFYLAIEVWFKKYMVQYVFVTKTESGGRFWRLLVNRLLFSVLVGNAVIALVVGAQGVGSVNTNSVRNGGMLFAMIPLPFLLFAFKWYCKRAFDDKLLYYSTEPFSDAEGTGGSATPRPRRNDRVAVRFGHPALYKKLITPVVHAKSLHLLKEIYSHGSSADRNIFEAPNRRSTDRAMPTTPLGYSDVYMAEMNHEEPGQAASPNGDDMPPVEIVAEEDLDFEHFKRREEFREQFGGKGELYGRPDDLISRPRTPSTFATMTEVGLYGLSEPKGESKGSTRNSSATKFAEVEDRGDHHGHSEQREDQEQGMSYEVEYQQTPLRDTFEWVDVSIPTNPLQMDDILSAGKRARHEETFGQWLLEREDEEEDESGEGYFPGFVRVDDEDTSYDRHRQNGKLGGE
ncbi:DUF221-domain-containing protein [Lentithecium fluviatile CBS 122367]|uniref:DUF221-domain-containing protein n=1 Tax=Lentithecium fluviatile CBS 122367 TaxID=1168545 RepID=A0A6G1ITP3_9PLEO|nr:DUF221-domain-containing protein [Lentithecium fluviatile CBS 122367]